MAARAGVQRPHHGVALERHARCEGRRQRQAFTLHLQVQRIGVGQGVDTQQLHGHVVFGTPRLGGADQCAGGSVEVVRAERKRVMDCGGIDVQIRTVGGQQVDVAHLGSKAAVVDLDVGANAQGTAQKGFDRREVDAVVLGQLLQRLGMQPVDTCVPHMQQVHFAALQNQRAEGADITTVFVETRMAAHGLGM